MAAGLTNGYDVRFGFQLPRLFQRGLGSIRASSLGDSEGFWFPNTSDAWDALEEVVATYAHEHPISVSARMIDKDDKQPPVWSSDKADQEAEANQEAVLYLESLRSWKGRLCSWLAKEIKRRTEEAESLKQRTLKEDVDDLRLRLDDCLDEVDLQCTVRDYMDDPDFGQGLGGRLLAENLISVAKALKTWKVDQKR